MVAAVGSLGHGRAAELAAPDDQRAVEQAAGLEVGEQGGDRLVDGAGVVLMAGLEVGVLVPAVGPHARAEHLDEPHSAARPAAARSGTRVRRSGWEDIDRKARRAAGSRLTRRRGSSARGRPPACGRPARSWRWPLPGRRGGRAGPAPPDRACGAGRASCAGGRASARPGVMLATGSPAGRKTDPW